MHGGRGHRRSGARHGLGCLASMCAGSLGGEPREGNGFGPGGAAWGTKGAGQSPQDAQWHALRALGMWARKLSRDGTVGGRALTRLLFWQI